MWPLVVLAFIVVPLIEIFVIVQVGQVIGPWWTVALLLVVSIAGASLFKREGLRAARNFRSALSSGRIPATEVVDGALVVFGGALLLTPGFVTDILGLAFVVPPTRALANRMVRNRALGYLGLGHEPRGGLRGRRGRGTRRGPDAGRGRRDQGEVVDVEVVSVERDRPQGR